VEFAPFAAEALASAAWRPLTLYEQSLAQRRYIVANGSPSGTPRGSHRSRLSVHKLSEQSLTQYSQCRAASPVQNGAVCLSPATTDGFDVISVQPATQRSAEHKIRPADRVDEKAGKLMTFSSIDVVAARRATLHHGIRRVPGDGAAMRRIGVRTNPPATPRAPGSRRALGVLDITNPTRPKPVDDRNRPHRRRYRRIGHGLRAQRRRSRNRSAGRSL
jgi:hypothetical protein